MFLNSVIVQEHPTDPFKWILHDDLIYKFPDSFYINELKVKIVIPKGFVTDFASVPRFAWNIIPPYGEYKKEAVLHDYLYATGLFPKKIADKLFLISMKEAGVSYWKRNSMYLSVKLFGGTAWSNHRLNEKLTKLTGESYPKLLSVFTGGYVNAT